MSRRAAIYRLYDASRDLLYIGRTCRPPSQRMHEHEVAQSWWDDVATGTIQFVDRAVVFDEERRAILAENPRHNHERHPVKPDRPERRIERVWTPMPDELYERLRRAGRRYTRTATTRSRLTLSALVYEAFMAGCSPLSVAAAAGIGREQARRYAEAHRECNPGLAPTPRLHGNGAARHREAS